MGDMPDSFLLGLDRAEFAALVEKAGEPAYRARQLMDAIYRERVESVEQISTLPQQFRMSLQTAGVAAGLPQNQKKIVSQDGTLSYPLWLPARQNVPPRCVPPGDPPSTSH